MDDIARTIVSLTNMIAVNGKRIRTYLSLAEKTANSELKALFSQCAEQSKRYTSNLSTWRSAYGGFGVTDKPAGNSWTQVWSFLDRGKSITSQCEDLENEVLKVYRLELSSSFMPPATVKDVEQQAKEFEKVLLKLKSFVQPPELTQRAPARK